MLKGQFTHSLHCHPAQQGSGAVGGLPVKHLGWKKQLSGVVYDVTKTDPVGLPGTQPLPRAEVTVALLHGHPLWEGKVWEGWSKILQPLVGMCVQHTEGLLLRAFS